MSVPPDNLTTKLAALTSTLGGKLDIIAADIAALRMDVAALQGDAPSNTLQSITQSLWNIAGPAPGTTMTDLLRAVQASAGTDSSATISAILAAIGSLESDPTNYTVKELLALLQTSLDIQPTEKAGPNVPPGTEVCGPWIRATSVVHVGTAMINGVGHQAWSIIFPDTTVTPRTESVAYTIDSYVDSAGPSMRRYQRSYTATGFSGQVCLGWNTLNHSAPLLIASIEYTLMGLPSGWFWDLSQVGSAILLPGEGPMPVSSGYSAPTHTNIGVSPPAWVAFNSAVEYLLLGYSNFTPDFSDYFISAKAIA